MAFDSGPSHWRMQSVYWVPLHRPNQTIGPNQYMSCTKLPISLVCDSCGHRMPKASKIAVTHDVTRSKEGIVAYGSKMYLDCTNCVAEMIMERKANGEYVILSGATPYFRPEDEKLECPPKVRTTYYCTRNGNLDSPGGVASSSS